MRVAILNKVDREVAAVVVKNQKSLFSSRFVSREAVEHLLKPSKPEGVVRPSCHQTRAENLVLFSLRLVNLARLKPRLVLKDNSQRQRRPVGADAS